MANINIYPSTTTQTFTTSTQDILLKGVNSGLMIYNADTGSTDRLTISGSTGTIFSVSDSQTGLLWSVNDIAANPIAEIYSDARVEFASDSVVNCAGSLKVNGSIGVGSGITRTALDIGTTTPVGSNEIAVGHLLDSDTYTATVGFYHGTNIGAWLQYGRFRPFIICTEWENIQLKVNDGNYGVYKIGLQVTTTTGALVALPTYSTTISSNVRDLQIDDTGKLGYVSSTLKSKHNITDIESVDWLQKLRPVNFIYNNDETNSKQSGLIAEEVLQVKPEFVSLNKEGEPETVLYSQLITPLLKAIQDLKKKNEELEKRIEQLEKLNNKRKKNNLNS